ncbi:MAG: polysaccharide biosynthesis C-terminal domain-containing protein, partial [Bacteroidota bacterium]
GGAGMTYWRLPMFRTLGLIIHIGRFPQIPTFAVMNPFKRLAGQTAIYGIPSILGRFLNYLLVPLYTYGLLTQGQFGIVNLFYSYTALLMVFLTYGMETAFFRFSETELDKKSVYSTGLISLLATTGLFLIFTNLFPKTIAGWLQYPQYPNFIIWFSWIMALDVLSAIPFARLRALNRPIWFSAIKSVNIFTLVLLNLFFLLLCPYLYDHYRDAWIGTAIGIIYRPGWTIEYIFIANLLASLVTLILLLPQVFNLQWKFDAGLWKRMILYSLPLMIAGMAGIVNETIDRILLRYLLPGTPADAEAQVGIYSACYKIAVLMVLFIQAYRFAAEPFFFSQMKNRDAKQVYARIMDYFVIVVSTIFLVTMLFLDTVFIRLTGPEFRSARAVIPVLMLAKLFLGIYFNLSIWYKLTGKTLFGALITLIGMIITLGLNIYWIPLSPDHLIYGYLGSAWATMACYSVMMVLAYLIGQKYYPIPYNLKKFFGYIGLALLLYAISTLVPFNRALPGIGFNLLLLAFFAFVVYLFELRVPARRS